MRRLPLAVGLSRIHHLAGNQLGLLSEGRWSEALELLDERRKIIDGMGSPTAAAMKPLEDLCTRILVLDERIYAELAEVRDGLFHRVGSMKRARDTVNAYRPDGRSVPDAPRFIDLRK